MESALAFFVLLTAFASVAANVYLYLNTKWLHDKASEANESVIRFIKRRR